MPRIIACSDDHIIAPAEAVDQLDRIGFDPDDEAKLAHAALQLRRLSNNRTFLAERLCAALEGRPDAKLPPSGYSPQSIPLTGLHQTFFLRANIWPSPKDAIFRSSGGACFAYDTPHDHNFSFLTAGYWGPGYGSDYYEYDYGEVAGYCGEAAGLRFVERTHLTPGKMMLYRAHRDIHSQIAPEALSISLNIMHSNPANSWFDQYGFDLENGTVTGQLNPTSTEAFLRCAIALDCGGNDKGGVAIGEWFGATHPSERIRLASYQALAGRAQSLAERDAVWARAELSGSVLVAKEAAAARHALELQPQDA